MGFIAWLKGEEPGLFDQWLHSDDPGHFGEYLIEYALKSLPGYSKQLCNIYLPYKGRTSELDVVLLHETGIYVFESKNYSGWIFGDENGQYWTQFLNKHTKNRFYNPILQNKTHIRALKQYLKLDDKTRILSYIVFSERCELKKICEKSENTVVIKRPDMLKSIRAGIKGSPAVFTKEQIDSMYEELLPLTDVTTEEKKTHIEGIQKIKSAPSTREPSKEPDKPTTILCPKCGSAMVLRTASKGVNKGQKFYGCSNFPKCRAIINLEKPT
ncbi:NERD domain-containing protein [uncultured Oscillibacter sp.]|uniref:NERD domain-containing protein n=1 Tax=uncultured Oscillibacter sp. TaxID=876091 RepID=UPI0025F61A72|nr:NERD domain-containing protein [uncultured Oscillibacter sp.]